LLWLPQKVSTKCIWHTSPIQTRGVLLQVGGMSGSLVRERLTAPNVVAVEVVTIHVTIQCLHCTKYLILTHNVNTLHTERRGPHASLFTQPAPMLPIGAPCKPHAPKTQRCCSSAQHGRTAKRRWAKKRGCAWRGTAAAEKGGWCQGGRQ